MDRQEQLDMLKIIRAGNIEAIKPEANRIDYYKGKEQLE